MIEINFLPEEEKKKRKKIELPEIPMIPIATFLIMVLIAIQLLIGGATFIVNRQTVALERTWNKLKPKKAELDNIKKKISLTTKKTQAIEDLISKRTDWSQVLNELSNSIAPNIWLTSLSYNERIEREKPKGKDRDVVERVIGTLTLSGYAVGRGGAGTSFVTHFVQALRNNGNFAKYFSEIDHGPIKNATVSQEEVMSFSVHCIFKNEG